MDVLDKLRVLLPHWIEHNQGHAEECRKWATTAEKEEVQAALDAAFDAMEEVTLHLDKALAAAGGPKKDTGHHHHH